MVSATYEGGKALSKMEMRSTMFKFNSVWGCWALKVRNGFGQVVRLVPLSSLCFAYAKMAAILFDENRFRDTAQEIYRYDAKDIIFIKLYDPMQQVYGSPDYVGGIQSALLNS